MKLNTLEFLLMNNPVRTFIREHYEMKMMRKMSTKNKVHKVLEIGCGNGSGTRIIRKYFAPKEICAIDMDERMIKIAKRKNAHRDVLFKVMDAANLEFPDGYFDMVFDFGIIHHIPNWKDCLNEIHRVLKPGGEFMLEDLSIDSFNNFIGKIYRVLSVHPYNEIYSREEFKNYLTIKKFDILHYRQLNPLGLVKVFMLNAIKSIQK